MPFVQRVVSPTYLSRSHPRTRVLQPPPKSTVASPTTTTAATAKTSGSKVTPNNTECTTIPNGVCSKTVKNDRRVSSPNGDVVRSDSSKTNGSAYGKNSNSNNRTGDRVHVHFKAPIVSGYEFDSVTNITLSNALRQLASLVLIANDIFVELNRELQNVGERAKGIKTRIDAIEKKVEEFDPKTVTVPESDLETFVHIKNHFKTKLHIDKELFTTESRSTNLKQLYDAAAKTPICAIRDMSDVFNGDHLRDGSRRDSDLICTPVLGQTYRKMRTRVDVEIETRLPAAVEELRKWTSTEALGDITVTPDCISRVGYNSSMNNSTFCTTTTTIISSTATGTALQQNSLIQNQGGGTSMDVTDDSSTVIGQQYNRSTNEDVDLPLDHRLPSPEEQCQIIALKFPAEVVTVDITGKRFQRMCLARKTMTNYTMIGEENNLNDDVQTVKRRSRSRKPRGKRRNTITGTDQREIEEAANGDMALTTSPNKNLEEDLPKVPRSKSSDILKKDSPSSLDTVKATTLTRFNSLKQWGRNRLRLINGNRSSDDKKDKDKERERDRDNSKDKVLDIDNDSNVYEAVVSKNKKKFTEKERKLSHERKPSYSSSEKSLTIQSEQHIITKQHSTGQVQITQIPLAAASINPVKLRDSSSIRRQRRNGFAYKEEPHSSSGNWSASSESGRTSIGSEITVQPKSSASSTSLNHSNVHPGSSGPPSSIISRRRFLNTSACSSVTSEGTATPDLQMHDLYYDDETSSAYSCDTEGYYTSFHVDSGLKTLKEEEPMTPMHSMSALSSNTSFGSQINQTVLSAENEYELFGRGSTSTTTSSAGTVCTTLMGSADNEKSVVANGPAVPERKSSLTKLNRSNSNASNCTLERSYSSSTVGSTLERTGTIKRNGVILKKEVAAIVHQERPEPQHQKVIRIESPDSGNNTSSSPIETNSNDSPTQGIRSNSEFEYSECSDLEGVDRIERIRVKTAINSSRIPSMCIITPTTSDDEAVKECGTLKNKQQRNQNEVTRCVQETDLDSIEFDKEVPIRDDNKVQIISVDKSTGYATVQVIEAQTKTTPTTATEMRKDANFNNFKRSTLQPLNTMLGKLKGVLPNLKKSPNKEATTNDDLDVDPIYDAAGEYVTIADVCNNNRNMKRPSNGIYYTNDIVKRNLATVLSGNLNQETEYVSLNELPCNIRCEGSNNLLPSHSIIAPMFEGKQESLAAVPVAPPTSDEIDTRIVETTTTTTTSTTKTPREKLDNKNDSEIGKQPKFEEQQQHDKIGVEQRRGARVTFDAQGKIIYNSDSLKRRKGAHTTFVPGPCVKDPISALSSSSVVTSLNSSPSSITPGVSLYSDVQENPVKSLSPPLSGINNNNIVKTPLISGGCLNRRHGIVRPVVSQQKLQQQSQQQYNTRNVHNVQKMAAGILTNSYLQDNEHLQQSKVIENGNLLKSSEHQQILRHQQQQQHQHPHQEQRQRNEEDYQRLSHSSVQQQNGQLSSYQQRLPYGYTPLQQNAPAFQRNNQVYWTLQHRRPANHVRNQNQIKDDIHVAKETINFDDLYATPNKNRNRNNLKTTPAGFSTFFSPIGKGGQVEGIQNDNVKMSPIDPRNMGGFKTSTPTKGSERIESPNRMSLADDIRNRLLIKEGVRSANTSPGSSGRSTPLRGFVDQSARSRHSWAPDNPEVPRTCSDRLGTQKTSLMDFKKLLLATSSKSNATTKLSAVEMLKLSKKEGAQQPAPAAVPPAAVQSLNSSMNILELSGSPKTFANRRVLRQGNFGSPSKSMGKNRGGWRMAANRTDVMSTAIPEANSEEDTSSSNGSINNQSPNVSITNLPAIEEKTEKFDKQEACENTVIEEKFDMKTNIFLQAEENNFMKGERQIKTPIITSRSQLQQARAQFLMGTNNNNTKIQTNNDLLTQINNKKNSIVDQDKVDNQNSIISDDKNSSQNDSNNSSVGAPSLETAL